MLLPIIRDMDLDARKLPPYSRWGTVTGELREDLAVGGAKDAACLVDCLAGIDPEHHAEALQDLIAEHLRFSWRVGAGLLLEHYVELFGNRFEVLARMESLPVDLIEDEFLARHAHPRGDAPDPKSYLHRIPGRPEVLERLEERVLAERYVKLRRLGRGVSGEVWEARDRDRNTFVAIKQLHVACANRAEALRCFCAEAAISASLDHPGIVAVHDFVPEHVERPYLVMQLVRGPTLSDLIRDYHYPRDCRTRRQRRAQWNELLAHFETICAAVSHAHSRGVLHRDLKAGNIVADAQAGAVILDWGLAARNNGDGSVATGSIGTPEYMPPEQVHGRASERSDVFGLGALLHEMLTGRPLRVWESGTRPADWQRAVLEQPPPSPRAMNRRVPRWLNRLCLAAVDPDLGRRPAGAQDLLRVLREHRLESSRVKGSSLQHRLRRIAVRAAIRHVP